MHTQWIFLKSLKYRISLVLNLLYSLIMWPSVCKITEIVANRIWWKLVDTKTYKINGKFNLEHNRNSDFWKWASVLRCEQIFPTLQTPCSLWSPEPGDIYDGTCKHDGMYVGGKGDRYSLSLPSPTHCRQSPIPLLPPYSVNFLPNYFSPSPRSPSYHPSSPSSHPFVSLLPPPF